MPQPQVIHPVWRNLPVVEDTRQVQAAALAVVRHGGTHPQDVLTARSVAPDVAVARWPDTPRVPAWQRYDRAGRFIVHRHSNARPPFMSLMITSGCATPVLEAGGQSVHTAHLHPVLDALTTNEACRGLLRGRRPAQ